jgi:hypothetical protein
VQLVSAASLGRPVNVTVPVIGWLSLLSAEVTVAVQVAIPPFQSMLDGEQIRVVVVVVVMANDWELLGPLGSFQVSPVGYEAVTVQVPSSPGAAVYVIVQEATFSEPLRVQLVSAASLGRPEKVTVPEGV